MPVKSEYPKVSPVPPAPSNKLQPEEAAVLREVGFAKHELEEVTVDRADVMDFSSALLLLKMGHKLTRLGWNGKGMFIVLMPVLHLPPYSSQEPGAKVNDRTAKHIGENTPLHSLPYFAMKTADNKWQPGWLASQSDLLSNDWVLAD